MTLYQSALGAGIKRFDGPSILDGSIAHWDPDLSPIVQATGVSSYESLKGGASRTLTQGNGGAQPVLVPTGINGQPALQFDGSNDILINSAPFLATLPRFTALAIVQGGGENDTRVLAERSSTNPQVLMSPLQTRNSAGPTQLSSFIQDNNGVQTFINSTGPMVFDGAPHLCGTIIDTVAGTIRHFENDKIDSPDDYVAGPMADLDRLAMGGSFSSFTNVQQLFTGLIGPVVILPWVATAAELRELTRYYSSVRGYIPNPTAYVISNPVPAGYRLAHRDDFSSYASVDDAIQDGQAPSEGKPYNDSFRIFGTRSLEGNNDRCYKALGTDTGTGATSLADLGIEPHVLNSSGTLSLRMYELPAANRPDFPGGNGTDTNMQFAGGMITTEGAFTAGPGLWKMKYRIKHCPPGAHIAVWLLTETNPHIIEIDLLEVVGNNTFTDDKPLNSMFYNGHLPTNPSVPQGIVNQSVSNHFLNQWHELAFHHTADTFTWYVDGAIVRQEPSFYDDAEPLYLLVSWEGNSDTFKDFPGPADGNSPTYPADFEIASWEHWTPA